MIHSPTPHRSSANRHLYMPTTIFMHPSSPVSDCHVARATKYVERDTKGNGRERTPSPPHDISFSLVIGAIKRPQKCVNVGRDREVGDQRISRNATVGKSKVCEGLGEEGNSCTPSHRLSRQNSSPMDRILSTRLSLTVHRQLPFRTEPTHVCRGQTTLIVLSIPVDVFSTPSSLPYVQPTHFIFSIPLQSFAILVHAFRAED